MIPFCNLLMTGDVEQQGIRGSWAASFFGEKNRPAWEIFISWK
jgi:hypothetical protein